MHFSYPSLGGKMLVISRTSAIAHDATGRSCDMARRKKPPMTSPAPKANGGNPKGAPGQGDEEQHWKTLPNDVFSINEVVVVNRKIYFGIWKIKRRKAISLSIVYQRKN